MSIWFNLIYLFCIVNLISIAWYWRKAAKEWKELYADSDFIIAKERKYGKDLYDRLRRAELSILSANVERFIKDTPLDRYIVKFDKVNIIVKIGTEDKMIELDKDLAKKDTFAALEQAKREWEKEKGRGE